MLAWGRRRAQTEQLAQSAHWSVLSGLEKLQQLVRERKPFLGPATREGTQHRVGHVIPQHVRLVGLIDVRDLALELSATFQFAQQPMAHDRLVQTLGVIALGRHQDSMASRAGPRRRLTPTQEN